MPWAPCFRGLRARESRYDRSWPRKRAIDAILMPRGFWPLLGAAEIFTRAGIDSNHFADADERWYCYFESGLHDGRLVLGSRGCSFNGRLRFHDFQFHGGGQFETQRLALVHDDVSLLALFQEKHQVADQ